MESGLDLERMRIREEPVNPLLSLSAAAFASLALAVGARPEQLNILWNLSIIEQAKIPSTPKEAYDRMLDMLRRVNADAAVNGDPA